MIFFVLQTDARVSLAGWVQTAPLGVHRVDMAPNARIRAGALMVPFVITWTEVVNACRDMPVYSVIKVKTDQEKKIAAFENWFVLNFA